MIVRSKRPEAHYTVIQNEVIRDSRLSWRARGILVFLLSQPDNWKTTSAYLCSTGQEGRDSVRLAMTELEKYGYLARRKHQDERGRWTTATYVYDRPQNTQELSPPKPEYQASVNQALQEVTRKKDPVPQIRPKRKSVAPRICGNCDGAGWIPMGKGLGRCSCREGFQ